ncbi:hypothetical protein HPB50_004434 [Hyalomma asiaticum]|uniref:Uncharacterized protein n=1 Tax=Hyalomma asiaticum TaxID=266040 RepID=A0ACB7TAW5_HYAAI|nr:hypothetical protein HPB50_004434 [Hyalomma asiaticum]
MSAEIAASFIGDVCAQRWQPAGRWPSRGRISMRLIPSALRLDRRQSVAFRARASDESRLERKITGCPPAPRSRRPNARAKARRPHVRTLQSPCAQLIARRWADAFAAVPEAVLLASQGRD